MPDDPNNLPGNGFLGWLGRQVGHVKKAVKTDVIAPPDSMTVYRECTIEEMASPVDPNLKLRRTVIDEVIQESQNAERQMQNEEIKPETSNRKSE